MRSTLYIVLRNNFRAAPDPCCRLRPSLRLPLSGIRTRSPAMHRAGWPTNAELLVDAFDRPGGLRLPAMGQWCITLVYEHYAAVVEDGETQRSFLRLSHGDGAEQPTHALLVECVATEWFGSTWVGYLLGVPILCSMYFSTQ